MAQINPFLENFRVGFGAGVNFSHILESQSYNLYEDLTGAEYKNTYSGLFQIFGYQYFVQVDYRLTNIMFQDDTVDQANEIKLRYFEIPLEVRYTIDPGGTCMYGRIFIPLTGEEKHPPLHGLLR